MNLEVRGVEKTYDSPRGPMRALLPTSFEVGDGEFVTLVGPSGCGKSTTLYVVAGLEESTEGDVRLDGECIRGPGKDRGMVFQSYTLFPWLNVLDNVRVGFEFSANCDYSKTSGEIMADVGRAYSLLELMGLENFHHAFPRELSGGMKQRVAIARALTTRPKILLMDEPFGALDAQTRQEMQELLLLLSRHEKTTVLFVTHDAEEAIYLSTRILVFSGRPGTITREMQIPFGDDRPLKLKESDEFSRLRRELLALLHQGEAGNLDRNATLKKLMDRAA